MNGLHDTSTELQNLIDWVIVSENVISTWIPAVTQIHCYKLHKCRNPEITILTSFGYSVSYKAIAFYYVGYSTRSRLFSSPQRPDQLWGPPSLLYSGYPAVRRPERETDHLSPSSAEVKNGGVVPPLHSYFFMALGLIKYRDSFTLLA
jgi:hypothetical protein